MENLQKNSRVWLILLQFPQGGKQLHSGSIKFLNRIQVVLQGGKG